MRKILAETDWEVIKIENPGGNPGRGIGRYYIANLRKGASGLITLTSIAAKPGRPFCQRLDQRAFLDQQRDRC